MMKLNFAAIVVYLITILSTTNAQLVGVSGQLGTIPGQVGYQGQLGVGQIGGALPDQVGVGLPGQLGGIGNVGYPGQLGVGNGIAGVPRTCGLNELWQDCGTACPPTCTNKLPACTQPCVAGCQCSLGFLRNLNNQCVSVLSC